MSDTTTPDVGTIGWIDLTVPDAENVRDFYQAVVGWDAEPVPMGEHDDYNMQPPAGDPTAGICHAKGSNTDLPAQWLIYIIVADLEASIEQVNERGGEVIAGPKRMGGAAYCVIRDPAGAVCALYQPA